MLAKINRFHGNQAVRRVYRYGRSYRSRDMSLHVLENKDAHKRIRAGVVVSRKVNKSAVVRNRIRRRVYSQLRNSMSGLQLSADLLFTIYQSEVSAMPTEQLAVEINKLIEQAHLGS